MLCSFCEWSVPATLDNCSLKVSNLIYWSGQRFSSLKSIVVFNIVIVYCYESDNGIEFLDIQDFSLCTGTLKVVISDGIWNSES